jgi:hypothetical protein
MLKERMYGIIWPSLTNIAYSLMIEMDCLHFLASVIAFRTTTSAITWPVGGRISQ